MTYVWGATFAGDSRWWSSHWHSTTPDESKRIIQPRIIFIYCWSVYVCAHIKCQNGIFCVGMLPRNDGRN